MNNTNVKKWNIISAYQNMWKRAFDFKGRSGRAEFWWAILLNITIEILIRSSCLIILSFLLPQLPAAISIIAKNLYSVITLIPVMTLAVRRFHDVGRSWILMFIFYMLCIADIIMFALLYKTMERPNLTDYSTLLEWQNSVYMWAENNAALIFVSIMFLIAIIIVALICIIIWAMKGKKGKNIYGAPPLSGTPV